MEEESSGSSMEEGDSEEEKEEESLKVSAEDEVAVMASDIVESDILVPPETAEPKVARKRMRPLQPKEKGDAAAAAFKATQQVIAKEIRKEALNLPFLISVCVSANWDVFFVWRTRNFMSVCKKTSCTLDRVRLFLRTT